MKANEQSERLENDIERSFLCQQMNAGEYLRIADVGILITMVVVNLIIARVIQ
jgi:hypothetical protein